MLVGLAFAVASFAKDVITIDGKPLAASIQQSPSAFWVSMVGAPFLILIVGIGLLVNGWTNSER